MSAVLIEAYALGLGVLVVMATERLHRQRRQGERRPFDQSIRSRRGVDGGSSRTARHLPRASWTAESGFFSAMRLRRSLVADRVDVDAIAPHLRFASGVSSPTVPVDGESTS
jgi:hypothetical protein